MNHKLKINTKYNTKLKIILLRKILFIIKKIIYTIKLE